MKVNGVTICLAGSISLFNCTKSKQKAKATIFAMKPSQRHDNVTTVSMDAHVQTILAINASYYLNLIFKKELWKTMAVKH